MLCLLVMHAVVSAEIALVFVSIVLKMALKIQCNEQVVQKKIRNLVLYWRFD